MNIDIASIDMVSEVNMVSKAILDSRGLLWEGGGDTQLHRRGNPSEHRRVRVRVRAARPLTGERERE